MDKPSLLTRMVVEAIGTFGFFFLGFMGIAAATTLPGSVGSGGVAAGFGLGLMLMIFAFGHLSGGHLNPAVSLGLAFGGRFPWTEVLPYWLAQIVGGLMASALVRALFSSEVAAALVNAPGRGIGDGTALVLEIVATFLFVLVIQTVATDTRAPWHGVLAPVAIGGFIFAAATVIGPVSGGSLNPARSISPAVVAASFSHLWVYVVGPLVGGSVGGFLSEMLHRRQRVPEVEGLAEP